MDTNERIVLQRIEGLLYEIRDELRRMNESRAPTALEFAQGKGWGNPAVPPAGNVSPTGPREPNT